MSIHKTEALVIRRFDFRETSLLVTFFTRAYGKLSGVLKGIRTDPEKFASTVDLFSWNDIVFYRKRVSSVHLVTQCDQRDPFYPLRQDIVRAGEASAMMEMVNAIMPPEDRNEAVFELVLEALRFLQAAPEPSRVGRIFKIKMLTLSGFQPHVESCVRCSGSVASQARFSLALGGLVCPRCAVREKQTRSIFRGTVATLLHLQRASFTAALNLGLNPLIRRELDTVLQAFLQFYLEKRFRSDRVLKQLYDDAQQWDARASRAGTVVAAKERV